MKYQYTFIALGTDNEIQISDSTHSYQDEVVKLVEHYEQMFSYYRKESDIAQLNEKASAEVSDETVHLLREALRYHKLYSVFNLLMKPIQEEYFKMDVTISFLKRKLMKSKIRMEDIKIHNHHVSFLRKDMILDFGGIAKGFIVDQVMQYLKKQDVHKAIVNMGGDLQCWGDDFYVGIKHPFSLKNEEIVIACIKDKALATSGIYERCNSQYKQYHHVIDPITMKPSNNELVSVSVIADTTLEADVMATIYLMLGIERSKQYIQKNNHAVIFITKDKKLVCTKNLKDSIFNPKVEITYI